MKMDRAVVSEFAFLLALPTMSAATAYTLLKHHDILSVLENKPAPRGLLIYLAITFVVGSLAAYFGFRRRDID
jgi:undecaprenyl pyrophosphate phosphatase UppP